MRIAIMGAGAVGCCYGAWLAKAGHAAALIGRPAFVDAVTARGGLLYESGGVEEVIPVEASAEPAAVAGAAVVLVCVKSRDTAEAGALIAPHLDPDAVVLSFQNGIGNAERLAAAMGRPALAAAVYVAAGMAGPGHVRHEGRGDFIFGPPGALGPGAALDAAGLEALFAGAGAPARCSEEVAAAQWGKLAVNCAFNALSAATGLAYGPLAAVPGVRATMLAAVEECAAVAAAEGVTLPEAAREAVDALPVSMAGQRSSTAQDLAAGKPTEIDFLNGEVARRGTEHGVPTPVNQALWAVVRGIEAARG